MFSDLGLNLGLGTTRGGPVGDLTLFNVINGADNVVNGADNVVVTIRV